MTCKVTPFVCHLVTYETSVSFDEVIARLNDAINRKGSPSILSNVWRATNKDTIDDLLPADGFIFFNEFPHHKWLNPYHGVSDTPRTSVYVIGNPRFADSMLTHDLRAALNIPPRLLVLEKADRSGTSVQYHLPSSVIAMPGNSAKVREGAKMLDAKLKALVERVTHE